VSRNKDYKAQDTVLYRTGDVKTKLTLPCVTLNCINYPIGLPDENCNKSQTVLKKGQTTHSKARKKSNFVGGIRFPLVQNPPKL